MTTLAVGLAFLSATMILYRRNGFEMRRIPASPMRTVVTEDTFRFVVADVIDFVAVRKRSNERFVRNAVNHSAFTLEREPSISVTEISGPSVASVNDFCRPDQPTKQGELVGIDDQFCKHIHVADSSVRSR